eukprot:m.174311 g.174311  ORF g.174311 m.174311 type:complete len:126 (+) comp39111_c0_seq13:541-918(+)
MKRYWYIKISSGSLLDRDDVPWPGIYEFVFDRFRSILQDITIQRMCCQTTIEILLRCLRFFVYAGYRLRTSWPSFQEKLNGNMIQQCISQLLSCFENKQMNSCSSEMQHRWAEFSAIYILYNLGN